jgi:hypothetical protein
LTKGANEVKNSRVASDVYDPFLRWFRPARLRLFYSAFRIQASTRVIDLGGGPQLWKLAKGLGLTVPQVTVVNILPPWDSLPECLRWVIADACAAPFPDTSFDIVFSNSLVEHLPVLARKKFAAEVHRLGRGYFVQTPDKSFPIEPHFMTPFIHWLPKNRRRKLVRNFTTWGLLTRPTRDRGDGIVDEIELLNKAEMKGLFPSATLVAEKWAGMSKSIVSIQTDG